MPATVSLAAKISKYRQLKLLAAQSRHLGARFSDVFKFAKLRTTRLNSRHFECVVLYPLSSSCTLRVASAIAESSDAAVERARGAALTLVNSATDLRLLLQAVDSDVFEEFCATLESMGATSVLYLLRDPDEDKSGYMVTVTAMLPITDREEIQMCDLCMGEGVASSGGDVAVCVSRGQCQRDAVKCGCALALAELDGPAEEELCGQEAEATCFLRTVVRDTIYHDWGGEVLSSFLSAGVGWSLTDAHTSAIRTSFETSTTDHEYRCVFTDSYDNVTLLTLPLEPLPKATARIILDNEAGRLSLGCPLRWPRQSVVSAALVQLCAGLNASLPVFSVGDPGVWAAGGKSLEHGLFMVNSRSATMFLLSRGPIGAGDLPLIRLRVAADGAAIPLELEVNGGSEAHSVYAEYLREVNITAQREHRRQREQSQQRELLALLPAMWHLFTVALARAQSIPNNATPTRATTTTIRCDDFAWGPATGRVVIPTGTDAALARTAALFARDARLSIRQGENPLHELLLTSTSLDLLDVPVSRAPVTSSAAACERMVHECKTPGNSAVANAAKRRDREQEAFYSPDILLMIHEMRLALHLPQRSFPTIEFHQSAVHDVPRRVAQLATGEYGDVPVRTRVVAHWGPNLRAEAECSGEAQAPHAVRGPLRLLLAVIRDLYARVFPRRAADGRYPLVPLIAPNSRAALNFLLHAWFDAAPQIRCFSIHTRTARLSAAAQSRTGAAEAVLGPGLGGSIVRAMLFFDLLGQRVLFAETHAQSVREAVARVVDCAVRANVPSRDGFPAHPADPRRTRGFKSVDAGGSGTSEIGALLDALDLATRERAVLRCVPGNDDVDGVVEVCVPLCDVRRAAAVTSTVGVIPALSAASRLALHDVGDNAYADDNYHATASAAEWGPLLPRDGFPPYTARFYAASNLLGEVLQGTAGKYHCDYSVDPTDRGVVVCRLRVDCLAARANAAPGAQGFPLGVGRGSDKRAAWTAAATHALRVNFPVLLEQLDRHRQLSALARAPVELARAGCPDGFDVSVKQCGVMDFRCAITAAPSSHCIVERHASSGAAAYMAAADELLQMARRTTTGGDSEDTPFGLWDPTANYGKSAWHACCGALGVALGGKVALRFGGAPLHVRLVGSGDATIAALHDTRMRAAGGLFAASPAERLVFAATRVLSRAVRSTVDARTRGELRRLLALLNRVNKENVRCPRLRAPRRIEARVELALGCQCRATVTQTNNDGGGVTACAGVWLPGGGPGKRVELVLAEATARTTAGAFAALDKNIDVMINAVWEIILEVSAE